MQGVVFLNPDYGERGGEKYLPADEYLSGNVRRKLAEVRAKAETEPQYLSNVEALEKVQPEMCIRDRDISDRQRG